MLIDSHAHLDSPRYAQDREAMLRRAYQAGVDEILSIGIGDGPAQMHQAFDLCRQFNALSDQSATNSGLPRLYASVGVYPHATPEIDDGVLARLDDLLAQPEVIACGEIGLDYYHEGAPHDVQRAAFIRQLEVAAARKRPILIHCRPGESGVSGGDSSPLEWADGMTDAWEDLFVILEEHWRATGLGGVMHCFSGGYRQAARALDLGFLVSFAGNLTYAKAQSLRDVAARLPMDGVLVETDAPWLAPVPHRGQRNEPAWVGETARVLAGLLAVEEQEIAAATTKNFHRLMGGFPQSARNG
ncbi:MAG: TatD family hydrolase [Terracidiphilus sp.]